MTDENNKLLIDLEVRIKQLLFFCDSLKDENERLKSEIKLRQEQIDEAKNDLKVLKTK
jgi:peptidoglycan hydrolase CwlO-like protein